jgi:hypothetical protein
LMSMPSCTISQRGDISRSCRQAGRQAEGNRGRRAGTGGWAAESGGFSVAQGAVQGAVAGAVGGGRPANMGKRQRPAPPRHTQAPTHPVHVLHNQLLPQPSRNPPQPPSPPTYPSHRPRRTRAPTHLVHVLHSQLHCAVHLTLCREAPHTEANAGVCLQGRCEPGQGRTGQGRG